MELTIGQLAAILRLAYMMAEADGLVSYEEEFEMKLEEAFLGLDKDDIQNVDFMAAELDPLAACATVASIASDEIKTYIAAFLGTLMLSDGKITDAEVGVWRTLTSICSLPAMDIADAVSIMEGEYEEPDPEEETEA